MLRLLSTPGWLSASGATYDVPDSLPGYLLVYLAYRGDWVTREALATAFWPERSEDAALHNLRANLHRLRGLLAQWGQESALRAERHRVRLDLPTDVAALRGALARKDWTTAAEASGDALLATLSFRGLPSLEEWAVDERRVVAGLWRDAALAAARAGEQAGEPATAVRLLLRLAAAEVLTEPAMQDLLRLAAVTGRRSDAIDAFARFRKWLAVELGTQPATETVALAEALREPRWQGEEADFAGKSAEAKNDELPQREPITAGATDSVPASAALDDEVFVGRRTELAELARLLAQPECRLITILGPGGVGKSSLARRLLTQSDRTFPAGAKWVDLQDLGDVPAVLARLAEQFGVAINDTGDAVRQIARRLPFERVLAVLDNAERLAGLAAAADRLLDAAPRLTLVLTTRVRAGSRHERLFPLAGLAVPDESSRDLSAAGTFDAVRLFELRAVRVQRGFRLAENLAAVTRIVEAVGGLPLAIDLAAAWTRLLPPDEIARSLRSSSEVLERDPAAPGAVARTQHVSMNAVLERSWNLLSPVEREAMTALSAFHGGFTRAAAQSVADVRLSVLSALADKSMLSVDEGGRVSLHPLIASYAQARAREDATAWMAWRQRHARHFARSMGDLIPQARVDPRPLVAAVGAEFANCVAAWRFAVDRQDHELVAAMAPAFGTYFDTLGRYSEGAAELQPALELREADAGALPALAKVRAALAVLLQRKRELRLALSVATAGAEIAERCGDRGSLCSCLMHAGACWMILGQWRQARPLLDHAIQIAREDGTRPALAAALFNLGICEKKEGRFDEALRLYSTALAIERELRRHAAIVKCLFNIAVLYQNRNDWTKARDLMEEGLRHAQHLGVITQIPYLEVGLGTCYFELGRFDEAESLQRCGRQHASDVEERGLELHAMCCLARTAARQRRFEEAQAGFRSAARMASQIGSTPDLLHIAMYYAEVLRDTDRRVEAGRLWRMVTEHPRAEAGDRNSAAMWLDGLGLSGEKMADVVRAPVTLEAFIAGLLDADPSAVGQRDTS